MRVFFKRVLLLCLAAAFVVPVLQSCEEEEEEDTKLYMSGSVKYSVPEYVHLGETVTLEASGITEPEGVIYKWLVPSFSNDTLTSARVTVTFPDSIGQFTVNGIAYYEGYYNSSATMYVNTVDTSRNGSLTGLKYGNSIIDRRDGMRYAYVTLGSLDWFAQNLGYEYSGIVFKSSPAIAQVFGCFYTWDEATLGESGEGLGGGPQGVCPEGWSVPTIEDWEDLALAVSGDSLSFLNKWEGLGDVLSTDAYFNDERLWPYSPDNGHSNKFGWNAIPIGNTQYAHEWFRGYQSYAFFWSSSLKDSSKAYYRYLYYDTNTFPMNFGDRDDFGAQVRCVRLAK